MPVRRIEFEWSDKEVEQYRKEWDEWKGEVDLEIGPGIRARYRRKKVVTIGGQELRMYVPVAEREPIPAGVRCKACGKELVAGAGSTYRTLVLGAECLEGLVA